MKKLKWAANRPVKPDVDPLLAELRMSLSLDKRSYYAKANTSGLAPATLKNIQDGTTRRPMGVTIQMAYRMLGYELKPVRVRSKK